MIALLTATGTRPGVRLGLFLAVVALVPGVLALIAAGAGGVDGSGLAIAEATGAFSAAALQGLERKAPDMPTSQVLLPAVAPLVSPLLERTDLPQGLDPLVKRPADARSRILPLRL